jgi:hypothetical protein
MTDTQESPHHVGAHPAQTNHTHLHCCRSWLKLARAGEALDRTGV